MNVFLATAAAFVGLVFSGSAADGFSARFEEIKRSATKEQLYALLFAMPKGGDIHNHLGGANTPEMWYRVATSDAVQKANPYYARTRIMNCPDSPDPLLLYRTIQKSTFDGLSACCQQEYVPLRALTAADKAAWLSAMMLDRPGEGREEFFNVIWFRLNELFYDPHVTAEMMVENMKAFGAEGVRYIETQLVAPKFVDAKGAALPVEESLAIFERRLNLPDAVATGVLIKFQLVVLRFAADAEKRLADGFALVDRHRDRWVGINLAGREDNDKGYPLRFLETFRKMRRTYSGIGFSIHGGEVDEPNQHVRDTLLLGATRIGHGLNLITDPETLLLMRNSRFLVEINLISNRLLEYFPDLSQHPFPEYLRTGVPVCLNTDDRGMWDSNMTDEYFTGVTTFNLTWDELKGMAVNSLEYSFARPEEKARMVEALQAQTEEFAQRFGQENWAAELAKVKPISSGYAAKHLGIQFAPQP